MGFVFESVSQVCIEARAHPTVPRRLGYRQGLAGGEGGGGPASLSD